jgi:hypothetical protein
VIKTYVEPGNNLNKYQNLVNNGIVDIKDSLIHKVSIIIEDDHKNKTVLNFNIKAVKKSHKNFLNYENSNLIKWDSDGLILSKGACLLIKSKTFYDNTCVELKKSDTVINNLNLSSIYFVNLNSAATHKSFDIVIKANVANSLRSKVMVGEFRNDKLTAVNAKYFMGFVSAKISSSAYYFVTVDTVSPLIIPKFKANEDLRKHKSLQIKIDDNLSGIKQYAGYIDGEWALFEYDAKNHLLTYTFDSQRIARNKKHSLKLIASDNKDNTAIFESSFLW